VPVGVQSDLNRRVPEAELDDFRVLTLGDEHRRMSVSEVMEPERITDWGSRGRRFKSGQPDEWNPPRWRRIMRVWV